MTDVFLTLLNMSITAGWLILAAILLRLVLKKAPKSIHCVLWGLVALRLICPFSFESSLSLIPNSQPVTRETVANYLPDYNFQTFFSDPIPSDLHAAQNPAAPVDSSLTPGQILSMIWLLGVAVMLFYAGWSYFRLYRRVAAAIPRENNLWICDEIDTPFILGIIRPRIYLPSSLGEQHIDYVTAHEHAHLKRRDHWWKPMAFLLLSIYWFNPLIWLAYILFCRDIELACDECVIKNLTLDGKKSYSHALLSCSTPRQITACPLAFGEVGVKERIKTVLNYKKPAFWVLVAAVISCSVIALCFLTNPHPTLKWAQNLSADDIETVELVVFPQSSDQQYKLFRREELNDVVSLIHQSRGRYLKNPEKLDGGSAFFYIKMKDSSEHQIGNIGNAYLVIDGDYYKADYDWLSSWPETGDSPLPEDFQNSSKGITTTDVLNIFINDPANAECTVTDCVTADDRAYGLLGAVQYTTPENDSAAVAFVLEKECLPVSLPECKILPKSNLAYIGDGKIILKTEDRTTGKPFLYTISFSSDEENNYSFHASGQQISLSLDEAIVQSVMEHYAADSSGDTIRVTSYWDLVNPESLVSEDGTFKVYLLVMYQEYTGEGDEPSLIGGSYEPAVISLLQNEDGGFEPKDYWVPRDGSDFDSDVRENFPKACVEEVLNMQNYAERLEKDCMTKAIAYRNRTKNMDEKISDLLDTITSSPITASAPAAYIEEHQSEYSSLVDYKEYTLRYCFYQFLKGEQTDLTGHIMASACQDIIASMEESWSDDTIYETGQEWFDLYLKKAKELQQQYTPEELKKSCPATLILLQMLP